MLGNLKLLAVFPHPDDETLGLGSTIAHYSMEGAETYLVCATRGERGWFDSEGPDPGFEEVARIREAELRSAADHLALGEVSFLDYIDGDVDQAEPGDHNRQKADNGPIDHSSDIVIHDRLLPYSDGSACSVRTKLTTSQRSGSATS